MDPLTKPEWRAGVRRVLADDIGIMVGTGGPSGISAPVGSTWRQTDANASHGNLAGLLWNKVGSGTTEGTDWLVDYEGRWVSYTPTIGGFSLGTGSTTVAKYTRSGKLCEFYVNCKMGTSPTSASYLSATLPLTGNLSPMPITGIVLDSGTAYYETTAYRDTTYAYVYGSGTSGIAIGLNTLGFTWAVNDVVSVTGTYEIA